MVTRPAHILLGVLSLVLIVGCGEPMYENAGSQKSLLEDREACAIEVDQSPSAMAYRQNPAAHPDYPMQVFEEMNRCIERKGWKQVRSQYEQEQIGDAIQSEAVRNSPSTSVSDSAATRAFVQGVEDRLARTSNSEQTVVNKN
ncbi:hypothetical protein [Petrachloros mirabilis]